MDDDQPSTEDGPRRIKGYASTKDLDRVRDVVEPSAFKDTVDTFMKNPILFFNHNWNEGIGKVTGLSIDDNGLLVECELAKGTPLCDHVWAMIQQGVYKAFSFGFKILADKDVSEDPTTPARRVITKLDLLEVSVVTVPANAHATFSLAKGLEWGTDLFPQEPTEALLASAQSIHAKLAESITTMKQAAVVATPESAPAEPPVENAEETKGVPKFMDFSLADAGLAWDKGKCMREVRAWASSDGSGDKEKINWSKFSQCFFWYDDANKKSLEGYKLPFCFIEDGKPVAVPRGIFAAAAATRGARGGVSLPEADIAKVQSHISKYYKKMGKPSPYEQRSFDLDLEEFLSEVPDEKKYDAHIHLIINSLMGFKNTLTAVDAQHQSLASSIDVLLNMESATATEPPPQSDDGKGAEAVEPQKPTTTVVEPEDDAQSKKLRAILDGLKEITTLLSVSPH